jgi:hypothetical protein
VQPLARCSGDSKPDAQEQRVVPHRTNKVIAELPVSHPGNGIAINRSSNQSFVSSASFSGGSVPLFDGSSNLRTNILTLPGTGRLPI